MNRDSSIIPKIIAILGFLSVLGIILLFFRTRDDGQPKKLRSLTPEKLFTQVMMSARPEILNIWKEGSRLIAPESLKCDEEIVYDEDVGLDYFQCQPHLWQCYWQGGIKENPSVPVEVNGQTYHVQARASYPAITEYSNKERFYQLVKGPLEGLNFHSGMLVQMEVKEIPGLSWPMIMTDSCRDVYLPERIYGYGKLAKDERSDGFIWDNFDRKIFIDKFYVTNQQVNEWFIQTNKRSRVISDRKKWPEPAIIDLKDQKAYCAFLGKRVLEAKLFDAATMTPTDLNNFVPDRILRPATPWQRDHGRTFLGMARKIPDLQLSPLDCQLAQVKDCPNKLFSTDSATWMGMHYALGFYPESLVNNIEPEYNLKESSQFLPASSKAHELGVRSTWNGEQTADKNPVAFRCYEEVSP